MSNLPAVFLIALCATAVGFVMGAQGSISALANDCEKMGVHRAGNAVYKCERVKP